MARHNTKHTQQGKSTRLEIDRAHYKTINRITDIPSKTADHRSMDRLERGFFRTILSKKNQQEEDKTGQNRKLVVERVGQE
jgi:hypothetical protein